MSNVHSTHRKNNFSSFNSLSFKNSKISFHNANFIWPNVSSYSSWKNLSKSQLWFLGKTARNRHRNKARLLHRSKKVKEKNEIQNRMELISSEVGTNKSITNGDVKLELITMLKMFWNRKNIAQNIEE